MRLILTLIVSAAMGLIPANIAKRKGYNFIAWWFYGWLLFIVALIHVCLIQDKNAQMFQQTTSLSAADELKKYKELLKQGVITESEFQAKKEQLLKLL